MLQGHKADLKKLLEEKDRIISEFPEISRAITEKRYTISDIGLQPRWVSHWEEKGIFFHSKAKEKWHTFSLVDALWMKIVVKLRAFNVSLKTIRALRDEIMIVPFKDIHDRYRDAVKATLCSLSSEGENPEYIETLMASQEYTDVIANIEVNPLENVLFDMLLLRNEYQLLLTENGKAYMHKLGFKGGADVEAEYNDFRRRSHLVVSLNELMSELVGDIGLEDAAGDMEILTKQEARIIKAIREEGVKEVSVRFRNKDNQPELLTITKEESVEKSNRIRELILRDGYQDISLKTQKGEVVYCENTRKERL